MKVSVFGGADPKPGDAAYEEALELGGALAKRGHTVLTGGYIGTMEAASRGAVEAGGHVVGVTCREIEQWRGVRPNQWVREEWRCEKLMERLIVLVERCDAAIALAGGAGTLAEICLLWNLMLIDAIPHRPLVLVGQEWHAVFDTLFDKMERYITPKTRSHISFARDVQEAASLVNGTGVNP